jgi:hypothetical protein
MGAVAPAQKKPAMQSWPPGTLDKPKFKKIEEPPGPPVEGKDMKSGYGLFVSGGQKPLAPGGTPEAVPGQK